MGLPFQLFDQFRSHFEIRDGGVLVKDGKKEPARFVPSERVAEFPYIVINPGLFAWVHIDVDLNAQRMPHPAPGEDMKQALQWIAFDPAPYEALNIPLPAFSVLSGRSFHLLWPLLRPLPPHPSLKSRRFYHDVRRNLIRALGGDIACGTHMIGAKNPFFAGHTSVAYPVGPSSLEALRLDASPQDMPHWHRLEYESGQRNCASFRAGLAFFHRLGGASVDEVLAFLAEFQAGTNAPPLDLGENTDIAKSVVFNGERYKSRADRNYGVMGLATLKGTDLPAEERRAAIREHQAEGGRYAAEQRAAESRRIIVEAIKALESAGQKVTGEAVARAADVDVRTVRRHLVIRDGRAWWKLQERNQPKAVTEEQAQ